MTNEITKILNLLTLAEKLKFELRHSWLSNGRQESVAEHTWQMALMAILLHRHLEIPVDLEKTLKMILIHDLIEAEAGDIPFFEVSERKSNKVQLEQRAIENIKHLLQNETGNEIYDLWYEFEAAQTNEAKFAKAIDNLEVQQQHNLASLSTWEPIEYELVYNKMDKHCDYDPFLKAFCHAIKMNAENKMTEGGVDLTKIKSRVLQS